MLPVVLNDLIATYEAAVAKDELVRKGRAWANCGFQDDAYPEALQLISALTEALAKA